MTAMEKVKFTFDDGVLFDGFAVGTTWNGFDNVKVAPETLDAIKRHFDETEPGYEAQADGESYWPSAGADGLVDLSGGYATVVVRPFCEAGEHRIADGDPYIVIDEGGDTPRSIICLVDLNGLAEEERERLVDLAVPGEGHSCVEAGIVVDAVSARCTNCGRVLERSGDALVVPDEEAWSAGSGPFCICGHPVAEHQTGEGPWTGFCYRNDCSCEAPQEV